MLGVQASSTPVVQKNRRWLSVAEIGWSSKCNISRLQEQNA